MTIKVTYNITDVYMSQSVSPVYINVSYSDGGASGGGVWGSITGTLSNQTDLQTALDLKLDKGTIDGGTEGQILSKASATDFDFAWINNYAKYLATNVRNQTGSTINAFQVVYISGATGNKPLISLADADTEATSSKTYGVTATAIANNGTGDVVTAGELSGINTSAFNEGDLLWLSTTAGGVVTTPPAEPAHAVFIGYVVRSHPTLGVIDVAIGNGYELTELHGVQITSAANNDGLFYNSSNSLWENKSIATVLGYTPVPTTRNITINGVTYDLSADRTFSVGSLTGNGSTNELAYFTASTTLASLSVSTYPSLTEISYVKGVTSALQTQLNAKQGTLTLTTTGTSGAATLIGNTLNIPQYTGGGGGISGSGAAGQVTYWTGASAVSGSAGLTYNDTTGFFTLTKNHNSNTRYTVQNSTIGTTSVAEVVLQSTTLGAFGKVSSAFSPYRIIGASDFYMYNDGAGDISFFNNFSTGRIKFATGGVFNSQMTLFANGNLAINSGVTDLGVRFGVVGDTLLRGSGATSATTALTVQNSSSTNLFVVRNDGNVGVGTASPESGIHLNGASVPRLTISETGRTEKAYFQMIAGSVQYSANAYFDATNWQRNNTALPSWNLSITPDTNDKFTIRRSSAASGTITWTELLSLRATGNLLLGTTTDVASSICTLDSTTKGFLPPRMTTTQKNAITSPAAGLVVYDTTDNKHYGYDGTTWNAFY